MHNFVFSKTGKNLALLMITFMFLLAVSPKIATAGFIQNSEMNVEKSVDYTIIKNTLENKKVSQQLQAFGYSQEEIETRLSALTDEEVHLLAGNLEEAMTPSGSGVGIAIGVVVVLLVALGVMSLMGKRVVVSE